MSSINSDEVIKGTVQTGVGRGSMFLSLPVYADICAEFLDAKPFAGTLNLQIEEPYSPIVDIHFERGTQFDNLTHNGKPTGGIILTDLTLIYKNGEEIHGLGVRPLKTSHASSIIEVISDVYLRERWDLRDGDVLSIRFNDMRKSKISQNSEA